METERRCSFYRSPGSPGMGHRVAYCEFDCAYAICDGEVKHCQKLHGLPGREWMKTRIKGGKTGR